MHQIEGPDMRRALHRLGALAQERGLQIELVSVPLRGDELLSAPGIRVWSVRADQMLALKIAAMRDDVDRRDAAVLARDLGFTTRDLLRQVLDTHIQDPAAHRDASYNLDEVLDALSEEA